MTAEPSAGPPAPPARSPRPRSLPLGRLDGIPLRVHWTFAFLVALVVLADQRAGWRAVAATFAWIAALFASVVVHELAHCLVARRRGATVLGILLLPIGGMSQLDKVPDRPRDELAVAAVGPVTSLALGALLLATAAVLGSGAWPPALWSGGWLARLGWLNLLLGAFNLVPALPMDGGRILRAGLERWFDPVRATRLAARTATLLAMAMLVGGVLYDVWLVLIGIFVLLGARAELGAAVAAAEPASPPAGPPASRLPGPTPPR